MSSPVMHNERLCFGKCAYHRNAKAMYDSIDNSGIDERILCRRHMFWQEQYFKSNCTYRRLKALHDEHCLLPLANRTR